MSHVLDYGNDERAGTIAVCVDNDRLGCWQVLWGSVVVLYKASCQKSRERTKSRNPARRPRQFMGKISRRRTAGCVKPNRATIRQDRVKIKG